MKLKKNHRWRIFLAHLTHLSNVAIGFFGFVFCLFVLVL